MDAYKLVKFHMHAPSEHTFDGNHYDLEFHFVNQNYEDGSLAVVSVPFDMNAGGNTTNDFISEF
jgi:carbonic anhydrase